MCSVVGMASFDLKKILDKPSLEQLDSCKMDDLLAVASHFQIAVGKKSCKAEIRSVVYNRLVELDVLGLPTNDGAAVGSVVVGSASVGSENESEEELMPAEADVRARVPPFEPFSPVSTGSKRDMRLNVRLARLQFEAQEKAQTRQAEMDLRL